MGLAGADPMRIENRVGANIALALFLFSADTFS